MRKKIIIGLLAGLTLVTGLLVAQDTSRENFLIRLLLKNIIVRHYDPGPIDDAFSGKVYKLFMDRLDYNKRFLIKTDVRNLTRYQYLLDDDEVAALASFLRHSWDNGAALVTPDQVARQR